MDLALGLSTHSGWAALVALGLRGGEPELFERRRLELHDPSEPWTKQPYHAAEGQPAGRARSLVERGIATAHRLAEAEVRAAAARATEAGHRVTACAVLVGAPLPAEWGVEEILAVHFRMHKAEGVLFRDALCRAAGACGLALAAVTSAELAGLAAARAAQLKALGKRAGPPWGKDQKDAALAALFALSQPRPKTRQ